LEQIRAGAPPGLTQIKPGARGHGRRARGDV